jgi:hypothetical protein
MLVIFQPSITSFHPAIGSSKSVSVVQLGQPVRGLLLLASGDSWNRVTVRFRKHFRNFDGARRCSSGGNAAAAELVQSWYGDNLSSMLGQ